MGDIVVVGSCNIDMICYVPKLPKPGETIHGTKYATGFGGKGANQCVAAARLGGKTTMVARVGDDENGTSYINKLKEENVDTKYIAISKDETTGVAQIVVEDSSENQIVIVAGANHKLCPDDVMKAKDVVTNAKVLIMQLETPLVAAKKAMQLCKGISILNGAPAIANYDCTLFKWPTIFCVNESEASIFTGLPVNNQNETKAAVAELLKLGCKSVLLTMGPDGALYATQERPQPVHIQAPAVKAVDTTGAGDCFIGALAYMLANRSDLTIEQSIEVSCRIAAISVMRPGTQISYGNKTDLQKVLKEMSL